MEKWYAIKITSGKDAEVERMLREMGIEAMAPRYKLMERRKGRWREREKFLLAGYVLVYAEMTAELWQRLKNMWYVLYVLSGNIDDGEIAYIKNYSQLAATSEIDYTGDYVTYKGGIACDVSKIRKVDKRKGRALVELELGGERIQKWLPVKIVVSE